MQKAPIDKAIDAVGSLTELARRLGVDPQVIVNWRKRGIPVAKVPEVQRATVDRDANDKLLAGALPKVSKHELRPDLPDIFPKNERISSERAA